jgi:hypothetical protein
MDLFLGICIYFLKNYLVRKEEKIMLEGIFEKLRHCNSRQLENQFVAEDLDKEILYYGKDLDEEQIAQRQKFLNDRLAKRKNLYIYPEQVNV